MIKLKILGYIAGIIVVIGGSTMCFNKYSKPTETAIIEQNEVSENQNTETEEQEDKGETIEGGQTSDESSSPIDEVQDSNAQSDNESNNDSGNFENVAGGENQNNDDNAIGEQETNEALESGKNEVISSNPVSSSNMQNSDAFMAQVEQMIYSKVNEERSKNGLNALSYSRAMENYARIKSKDMGDNNYFDHKDLSGNYITTNMKNDGISYSAWAENIAYIGGLTDQNALAAQFMNNWMNSEGHRKNILSPNYTEIGIGVYKAGNKVYATQEFYR